MSNGTVSLYEFGPFQLNGEDRLLTRQGKPVELSNTVFEVLLLLVEGNGSLVKKEAFFGRVWKGNAVEDSNLTVAVTKLRGVLGDDARRPRYVKTVTGQGYRFIARTRSVLRQATTAGANMSAISRGSPVVIPSGGNCEADTRDYQVDSPGGSINDDEAAAPAGGALKLDSRLYLERRADNQFHSAIARHHSIVLVQGARQVGKTSLLGRGVDRARRAGARVVLTDFQSLNSECFQSVEQFLFALAGLISTQLGISSPSKWDSGLPPTVNFEAFIRNAVLAGSPAPIVWGLDEVDRLFRCDLATEVFALFRSWHNKRALDPDGPWRRLTLAIAYATEAHLFITDLNQSPFNVGTRIFLEDFTREQVAEFNIRMRSPLTTEAEIDRFCALVGGQPYLVHAGLCEMSENRLRLSDLELDAASEPGVFAQHLQRLLIALSRDPELSAAMKGVIEGEPSPSFESFYRLRSAGLISGDSPTSSTPRCGLYARYLGGHLTTVGQASQERMSG